MSYEEPVEVLVEDCQIIFPNFAGKEGPMNRAGDRNFCIVLDKDTADMLARDGWNVKMGREDDEGNTSEPYLQIAVGYKVKPPRIVMMTPTSRVNLDESTVETLDWVEIAKADVLFRSYAWAVGNKTGIKAYAKTLFVHIKQDALEAKYAINDVES